MKKFVYIILVFVLVFALAACEKDVLPDRDDGLVTRPADGVVPSNEEEYLLIGTVADINGNSLTISTTGGWDAISGYETVIAHLSDETVWETAEKKVEVGQTVTLQIENGIMESFPPQVIVISVWKID